MTHFYTVQLIPTSKLRVSRLAITTCQLGVGHLIYRMVYFVVALGRSQLPEARK